jgi:hypothetical protein
MNGDSILECKLKAPDNLLSGAFNRCLIYGDPEGTRTPDLRLDRPIC